MKGFKVTDGLRTRRVGVACNSLEDLKNKGCLKLGISDDVVIQLEDGTIVDDEEFFQTIKEQSVFVILKNGEIAPTGPELLYNALKAVNIDLLKAGQQAEEFMTENLKEKVRVLSDAVWNIRKKLSIGDHLEKLVLSHRDEDPDWFIGIETNADTKEKFMFRRAQDRIRGYLYKTQDAIQKSNLYRTDKVARVKLNETFANFVVSLKQMEYYGFYFDRSNDSVQRFCSDSGEFHCMGSLYYPYCHYSHFINPYLNRESRIIFSTWNLDHKIERSRAIIPAILEAGKRASQKNLNINSEYFHNLLFTLENLKLCHIVCHHKGKHNLSCDESKYCI